MSGPFLRNPYLLTLSIAIILVAGFSAFMSLPRLEDPRITNRFPVVRTAFPGASAELVEALVTEPLEDALDEIEEINNIQSTSRAGFSAVSVELKDAVTEANSEEVISKVRSKIREASVQLPQGVGEAQVEDQNKPIAFTRIDALVWDGDSQPPIALIHRLAEDLADGYRAVGGTELVRLYGGATEEITVLADTAELKGLGLTASELARRAAGADPRRPAGAVRDGDSTLLLEVDGALDGLDSVRAIPLGSAPDGSIVRLGHIADVQRGVLDPPHELALFDGKRGIFVAARMAPETQVTPWKAATDRVAADFEKRLGGNLSLQSVFDQSAYTNQRLGELLQSLLLGALVVMVVVMLTMGWRLSLLVGAALPLVAAATLFGIVLLGGQIHQMSIFGMIIALGLLIDNAIVVVDEIRKRREAGLSPAQAVSDASSHLVAPLFASTLTTALAFAPIVLLPGAAGDFVGYIGVSVILAISSSFFISMTVIAALAGRLGNFHSSDSQRRSWWRHGLPGGGLSRAFRASMRVGLKRPLLAMAVAAAIPIVGFVLSTQLGRQFFPPTDRNMFDVQVWLPTESAIERTTNQVRAIEDGIRQHPEVEHVHWLVGGSFPAVYYNLIMDQVRAPHYARGVVVVDSADSTERLVPILQREIDARFPGAQTVVRSFGQGPPIAADVQFRLFGPSIEKLQEIGEQLRLALASHPQILHTQVSMPRGEPKLWLDAELSEVERAGLTLDGVAAQLDAGLEGVAGGLVLEDIEQLPVRVRLDGKRSDLSALRSMEVTSAGQTLPLESLGELALRPELGGVTRYAGERCNTVQGYTVDGALPIEVSSEVLASFEELGVVLPAGYRIETGGSAEEDREAVGNLLTYAPVLVTIMMAAIILVFRSVRIAGILLVVAFLSVGMALLSTFFAGFPVSFNTILGTLGLIGIALNDSIVVLAAIRANKQACTGDHEAILEEVMGCTRHVLSTTLTTMGGFLPLLICIGGEFWPSLAVVLTGGVAGATLMALVFAPAAYVLVRRFGRIRSTDAFNTPRPTLTPKGAGASA